MDQMNFAGDTWKIPAVYGPFSCLRYGWIELGKFFDHWAPYVIGSRWVVVALD